MGKIIDISNQTFHRLTALHPVGRDSSNTTLWLCNCTCGSVTEVTVTNLRSGRIKSCGCLQVESSTTHGKTGSPEYAAWGSMIGRCYNAKNPRFSLYGGRGIVVCDLWRSSFPDFFASMGPRPTPKHSLDRIDVNGPYSPENCRWADQKTQCRNRRSNVRHSFDGKSLTLAEWSELLGVKEITLRKRISSGMTNDRVFSQSHLGSPNLYLPSRKK